MELDGKLVRRTRENKGYARPAFAKAVGISYTHARDIESGRRGASPQLAAKIAHVLATDVERLRADYQEGES